MQGLLYKLNMFSQSTYFKINEDFSCCYCFVVVVVIAISIIAVVVAVVIVVADVAVVLIFVPECYFNVCVYEYV